MVKKKLFRIGVCLLFGCSVALPAVVAQPQAQRVIIENEGWELVGDLVLPAAERAPVVLMLNRAAGDRTAYVALAHELVVRGIGSLRLDLRGHGESINLGRFVPYEQERHPFIWDSEIDVLAVTAYLKGHPRVDSLKIAIVGGSYSGEEMAEAGRLGGYVQAYVALSPGSFSDESIAALETSGVPWLLVTSKEERYLKEVEAAVQAQSPLTEQWLLPGTTHASNMFPRHPDLAERLAVWLAHRLSQ